MLKSDPRFGWCNALSVDNHQFHSGQDDVLAQCISIYPNTAMEHEFKAVFATNPGEEEEEYRPVSLAAMNHVFWRYSVLYRACASLPLQQEAGAAVCSDRAISALGCMATVDNPSRFCPDIDFLDSYIAGGCREWAAVKNGLQMWHGLEPIRRYSVTGMDRAAVSHSHREHSKEEEIKSSLNKQCPSNGAYPGEMMYSSAQVVGIKEVKISHSLGTWEVAANTTPKKHTLRMLPASSSAPIMYGSRMHALLESTAMSAGLDKIEEFAWSLGVGDDILSPFAEHYQGEIQVPPLSENGLRWRREVLGLMFTLAENNILAEVLQQCVDIGHSFEDVYEELCNNYLRGDDLPVDPLARIYHMADSMPSLCYDVPIFREERVLYVVYLMQATLDLSRIEDSLDPDVDTTNLVSRLVSMGKDLIRLIGSLTEETFAIAQEHFAAGCGMQRRVGIGKQSEIKNTLFNDAVENTRKALAVSFIPADQEHDETFAKSYYHQPMREIIREAALRALPTFARTDSIAERRPTSIADRLVNFGDSHPATAALLYASCVTRDETLHVLAEDYQKRTSHPIDGLLQCNWYPREREMATFAVVTRLPRGCTMVTLKWEVDSSIGGNVLALRAGQCSHAVKSVSMGYQDIELPIFSLLLGQNGLTVGSNSVSMAFEFSVWPVFFTGEEPHRHRMMEGKRRYVRAAIPPIMQRPYSVRIIPQTPASPQ